MILVVGDQWGIERNSEWNHYYFLQVSSVLMGTRVEWGTDLDSCILEGTIRLSFNVPVYI